MMRTKTEERNNEIATKYVDYTGHGCTSDTAIAQISSELEMDKLYVRSILRSRGLNIARKQKHARKDNLTERDTIIMKLTEENKSPDEIAKHFGITPTRVRQVIRDNIDNLKHIRMERVLSEIKTDVKANVPYLDIRAKYGDKALREIKTNLGYNLFRTCQVRRDEEIVRMGKANHSATVVSKKFRLCKDYIYTIWHNNGIRKDVKEDLTPAERAKRDANIYKKSKSLKISELAKHFDLSDTMIRIIIAQQKEKEK